MDDENPVLDVRLPKGLIKVGCRLTALRTSAGPANSYHRGRQPPFATHPNRSVVLG
jgi:hypothetical protein